MEDNIIITTGSRLRECMALRNKKNAAVATWLQLHGSRIKSDFISQLRYDNSPLSYSNAKLIADCLDIDEGYLLGQDDFVSKNYNDYLTLMGKYDQIEKFTPDLKRKANIIDLAGYSLRANFNTEVTTGNSTTPFSITVTNGKKTAEIPYSTLDEIEEQVRQFTATLLNAAIAMNQPKQMSIEEFEQTRQKVMK